MAKITFTSEKQAKDYTAGLIKTWRRDPAKLEEFAKFAERNSYRYSMKNTMLIMAQNDGAILCQSFGAWGKTKYNGADGKETTVRINKGQHGMKIWTPVQYCMVDLDGDGKFETRLADCTAEQKKLVKSGEIKSRKGTSFKLGSTFDIAQTDYPAELYPSILNRGTESVDHAAAFEALVRYGKNSLGCPVIYGDDEKNINGAALFGYFMPSKNEIHLSRNLKDTQKLSVLAHELGHAVLHKDGHNGKSTAEIEVEADIFSILLDSHLGLEVEETRKSHLVNNFNAIKIEVPDKEKKDIEGYKEKRYTEIFDTVFKKFREEYPKIRKEYGFTDSAEND